MRSVNKVILIGNLTRDPQMKETQNGQSVTTFGIATNREWVTSDGENKKSTEFHEIVAWGKLAEICNTYLKKGKLVYLEGYLKTRSWEMDSGDKKYRTEIVINDMIMLNKRSDNDSDGQDFLPQDNSVDVDGDIMKDDKKADKKEEKSDSSDEENVF